MTKKGNKNERLHGGDCREGCKEFHKGIKTGGWCHNDLALSAAGRSAHPTSQMTVTGKDLEEGWENSSKTGRPWGFYMHRLGPIWLAKLWDS